MYGDIRKLICQITNNILNMSYYRHIVYTYNVRTVEQKYIKRERKKLAKENSHNGDKPR